MDRSILVTALAAALVAFPGPAAAQDAPPAVPPPPTALAVAPPPAPPAEPWPKATDLTDLGALSLTVGVFTGTTVLVCGFTIGPGSRREACQGSIGGISLALIAASVPFFVLGARKQHTPVAWILDRATFTASARGGALGWGMTF